MSPKLSKSSLLQSLLILSKEICALPPLPSFLARQSLAIARKAKLLSILLEEFQRGGAPVSSPSAVLCFEEMYIVLQRIRALIEDCSNGTTSKVWLLMQTESVANGFRELTADLSTLLDIFPAKEVDLSQDVEELVCLARKQWSQSSGARGCLLDPESEELRHRVVTMLDGIKHEIVPEQSKLLEIFSKLGLRDSSSCRQEIESLQEEVQTQADEKSKSEAIALIGLVRYAKCVLFGASTPRSDSAPSFRKTASSSSSISEPSVPADFRCPISLELMRDPVVVATGQTYDRESITLWMDAGHNTCPKTGQTLAHADLIPNRALKNLIAMWCREQKIPFDCADNKDRVRSLGTNKAALEATRMTASFLVNKLLSLSKQPMDRPANGVVYELRVLSKTDSDSRACIAEAGALPLLVRYLSSDVGTQQPTLQVNAVTTILNLSILEENKTRIAETDGALNGIIEVLRNGSTWEAKGNAAATIFSLSSVHSYRKRLGRKTRVVKGLLDLAREGPASTKRDAMVAIMNLAADREAVARMVEGGVVEMTLQAMDELPEEAATTMEVVVKRGGLVAVAAAYSAIKKLGLVLREGSDRARESAAATLVIICRKGGSDMVAELVSGVVGIERVIWELMGTGTVRGRRKAATLVRILRRWAAGLDGDLRQGYSTSVTASSRTVLPSS